MGLCGGNWERAAPAAPAETRANACKDGRGRGRALPSYAVELHKPYPPPQNPLYPKPVSSHEGQSTRDCELGGEMGMSGTWLAGR
jgi:hypothetical protein